MIIIPSSDPRYGLTLQEMIDDVADNIRNATIPLRITSWINQEIMSLAAIYLFPYLHASSVFATIVGQRNYNLAPEFHYAKIFVNPLIQLPLVAASENEIANRDPQFNTIQGTVTHYSLNGRSIDLYKIPAEVFNIYYSFQRRPVKLISGTDVSDLPPEWHPLLVLGATKKGMRRDERGSDEYQLIAQEYAVLLKQLEVTLKRRPDVVTVFQDPANRPGKYRPRRDPSHYPNVS